MIKGKSFVVKLADRMGRNPSIGNPLEGAKVYRHHMSGVALNRDDIIRKSRLKAIQTALKKALQSICNAFWVNTNSGTFLFYFGDVSIRRL